MQWVRAVVLSCAACGYGKPAQVPADASADAAAIPDAATLGTHYHYVIDHELVPETAAQADQYGLDLDGNGTADNQLGTAFGTLAATYYDVQVPLTHAIDTGQIIALVDVQATDLQNATAVGYAMYDGDNPSPPPCNGSADTTCRHHLDGTGTFSISATTPLDPPLVGQLQSATLTAGPGHLPLRLMVAYGMSTEVVLIGAKVRLSNVSAAGISSGVVAGGIAQSDLIANVLPGLAASFKALIERDCCGAVGSPGGQTCNVFAMPPCGCSNSSTGQGLLSMFDHSPKDCAITVGEIAGNSLFQSDLTVEGVHAISVGVAITAVPATYSH